MERGRWGETRGDVVNCLSRFAFFVSLWLGEEDFLGIAEVV